VREFLYFVYDGIKSSDMGVTSVSTDSGLFEETFVANKTINEEKIRGRTKPYFMGTDREPLEFPLTLWFENGFDNEKLRSIKRWLDQDLYKEFYFPEQNERRYFCMMHGDSTIHHNGVGEGYFQITMRCNDSFVYSPLYIDDWIDFSNNPSNGTEITFENKGDVELKPELFIEKVGNGDISITNYTDNGNIFELRNLYNGEIIYVDNENEEIESDIPGVYRYSDHNDVFLNFLFGVNRLLVKGKCKLQFRYRFKFK